MDQSLRVHFNIELLFGTVPVNRSASMTVGTVNGSECQSEQCLVSYSWNAADRNIEVRSVWF